MNGNILPGFAWRDQLPLVRGRSWRMRTGNASVSHTATEGTGDRTPPAGRRFGRGVRMLVAVFLLLCPLALAQAAPPPNIVYLISDDQAYRDFGFMGNERVHTPHLDALADRSAVFPNGYVPSSVCRPSLATLLTGLYPHQHGIHFNHGPPGNAGYNRMASREEYERARDREFELIRRLPALPGILAGRGYRSLQTGKHWEGHWREAGFTSGMTTFTAPPDGQTFGGVRTLASGEKVAHGNGDAGLRIGRETMAPIADFLDEAEISGEPWLLWYAPYLPHQPHDSPERFYEMAASLPGVEEHELPYFASIAQFDDTVGELIAMVESRGMRENTLFVFVSDNGWSPSRQPQRNRPEEFAKTARSKRAPFDDGVRTPILLSWEGRIEPATHRELVSSVDLFPTLLAAAGVGEGAWPENLPGENLLPVAAGESPLDPERPVFGEIYPGDASSLGHPERDIAYRWIRKGPWKLIVPEGERPWGGYLDGPALYHIENDPREQDNRIDDPGSAEAAEELRAMLEKWWKI